MADEKITLGDIRKMVSDTLAEAMKGVTPPNTDDKDKDTAPANGTRAEKSLGIAEAVKAEIERIKGKEKEAEEKETLTKKLAELAEATKEKPPVERRRVHKFMGWGE